MKSVIIGTAGHIDHGKTALVKALTGIDADRLEEEKRRGITIDIGFAHLQLMTAEGEELRLGFVDVPGHERFVRNMLAGVGGIDLVLLVVAADEGIKPQTREHFDICRLLSVRRGFTVLTKADNVDSETLDVVRLEVEEFLLGSFLDPSSAPVIAVSSLTGAGLDELKQALVRVASEVQPRDSAALARLPIDRVFSMKGFGTVVTGTLVSGTIFREQELEAFPTGKRVRVRGVQVHGQATEKAMAGQRTALNVAGASTEELARGMMLAPPETFKSTQRADVSLTLFSSAKPLKQRARVHLHAYTSETLAEVRLYSANQIAPGQSALADLRLEDPVLLLPGDRFILRQFSPAVTIGGGIVLDASPFGKAKKREVEALLETLSRDDPQAILQSRIGRRRAIGLSLSQAVAETGWPKDLIAKQLATALQCQEVLRVGDTFVSSPSMEELKLFIANSIEAFHKRMPLAAGMGRQELLDTTKTSPEVFAAALDVLLKENILQVSGELVHLAGRGVVMKDEEAQSKNTIEQAFATAGLQVPALSQVIGGLKIDKLRAQKLVTLLLRDKILFKISDDLVFHHSALEALRRQIAAYKAKSGRIDVGAFKQLTGVSRKYAIPLLEYLDRERVTKRVGDAREIL